MANNVYVTTHGEMYIAPVPLSFNDSIVPYPSAALVAALTATPVPIATVVSLTDQQVGIAGTPKGGFF